MSELIGAQISFITNVLHLSESTTTSTDVELLLLLMILAGLNI